ncbi:MAG: sulfite exporter TauE/SafE family protein [Oscillospiraceae bacterium]|nr:sulfite exporter TauE/SafE family protein [Oscillospiraceae bacterium]
MYRPFPAKIRVLSYAREGDRMKHKKLWYVLSGLVAGVCNGFFGGGGGTLLVPLLTRRCQLEQRKAFATSVAVILPLCALSALIYFLRGELDVLAALPYLIGGLVGGFIGGKLFRKVNMVWLRRAFALLILYGGVKALFF